MLCLTLFSGHTIIHNVKLICVSESDTLTHHVSRDIALHGATMFLVNSIFKDYDHKFLQQLHIKLVLKIHQLVIWFGSILH